MTTDEEQRSRALALVERARAEQNRFEQAEDLCRQAVELWPDGAAVWFARGELHEKFRRLQTAIRFFEHALAHDKKNATYAQALRSAKERLDRAEMEKRIKELSEEATAGSGLPSKNKRVLAGRVGGTWILVDDMVDGSSRDAGGSKKPSTLAIPVEELELEYCGDRSKLVIPVEDLELEDPGQWTLAVPVEELELEKEGEPPRATGQVNRLLDANKLSQLVLELVERIYRGEVEAVLAELDGANVDVQEDAFLRATAHLQLAEAALSELPEGAEGALGAHLLSLRTWLKTF